MPTDAHGQGKNEKNESLIDDANQNQRIMTVASASDASNQVHPNQQQVEK